MQEAIFLWLAGIASPALDSAMSLITSSYVVLIPLALLLAASLTKKKEAERRAFLYRAIASVLLTYLVVTLTKGLVAEPRPCATPTALPVRNPMGCEATWSFPSMHAALVFSVLPFLLGSQIAAPYFAYAVLVGLSRVYLGLHYPLDVIAGAVFGFAIGKLLLRSRKV